MNPATEKRDRNPLFDIVKGFLMYFVIRGHLAAAGIVSTPTSLPPAWIGAMIVGASMPCFFAISGLFSRRTLDACDGPKIGARIAGFLWPVFSFGIVFGCFDAACGRGCGSIVSTPFFLLRSLWFLRTLAIVYLISAVTFSLARSVKGRLCLFAIVYAALVFLPRSFPGYRYWKDVMHMIPYFVFGLFLLGKSLAPERFRLAVAACALFFAVAFLGGQITENGMGFYWVSSHWRTMLLTRRGAICFFGRTIVGIAGTISLLWLFRLLLSRVRWLRILAPLGTTTLGVYVMHQWLLARIGAHFHPPFPLPNGWKWCVAAVVLLVCHALVVIILQIRFTQVFFLGDERMLRRAFSKLPFRPASDSMQIR